MLKRTTIFRSLMALFIASLLLGCGTKESIDPAFAPEPLDEQLRRKPLRVSLKTDPMKVEEIGREFGEVSELGGIFQSLANVAANIYLEQEGGQAYEIDPIIYFAPELDQIEDWSMIERLGVDKLAFRITDSENWQESNLEFIKEVRLYVDFVLPEEGQKKPKEGAGILVASYNKEVDTEKLTELGRRLELKINDVSWKEVLQTKRTFVIYTELIVESVPKAEMDVSAEVGVFVGLKTGL